MQPLSIIQTLSAARSCHSYRRCDKPRCDATSRGRSPEFQVPPSGHKSRQNAVRKSDRIGIDGIVTTTLIDAICRISRSQNQLFLLLKQDSSLHDGVLPEPMYRSYNSRKVQINTSDDEFWNKLFELPYYNELRLIAFSASASQLHSNITVPHWTWFPTISYNTGHFD
jgi:hypothetical protein